MQVRPFGNLLQLWRERGVDETGLPGGGFVMTNGNAAANQFLSRRVAVKAAGSGIEPLMENSATPAGTVPRTT